ncbi:hypothetical protein PaG_03332 [Moesziomyces aphidis]|uniref:Uncharacterized protein n=1 Tax=Moesziomyces aphidis TaxID=84754 RepID=W3VL85_MOEAP|nr:hypothetical protein PaG_03332 [Moesziomyces aphidis]
MEEWTCDDAGAKSKRESQKERIEKKRWRRREVDVWRIKNGDPDARLMQTRRWRRRPSERQRQSANGGSSDLAIQAGRQAGSSSLESGLEADELLHGRFGLASPLPAWTANGCWDEPLCGRSRARVGARRAAGGVV